MPPKRNRRNSESPTAGAMAECVLPLDMMLCILTRLPVKSIHRFKSVCKPLREVLSSPLFAKMHRAQFPHNPENQSVVIYGCTSKLNHTISLLKVEENKPTKLDIAFLQVSSIDEFVGCCNGLLCMAFPQHGRIALWNPALNNISKCLRLSDLEIGYPEMMSVSVGFGYNEEADDFKVIIIADLEKNKKVSVKVYSANSNSWSKVDVDFQFIVSEYTNDAIVNGSPYWIATVEGEQEVLLCFDIRNMVFKIVPLLDLFFGDVLFVDWKGDLGALVCNKNNERVLSLDVWVFDDVGNIGWTRTHSFGPIELKVDRFLQCLENGKILVGRCLEDGKLFVFDTENGGVNETLIDETLIDGAEKGYFQVYGYTESLAYIKGMQNLDRNLKKQTL